MSLILAFSLAGCGKSGPESDQAVIESIFDIDGTIVTGAESVEHFDVEIGFIMPLSWLGSGAYTGFDGVSPISR